MKVNAIASASGHFAKGSQSLYPSGFDFKGVSSGLDSLKDFSAPYMGFSDYQNYYRSYVVPMWQYWQSHRTINAPPWWKNKSNWWHHKKHMHGEKPKDYTAYNPYSPTFSPYTTFAKTGVSMSSLSQMAQLTSGDFTLKSLFISAIGFLAMIFV